MSYEKTLITKSREGMLNAYRQDILRTETLKGCSPEVFNIPVGLEPPFLNLRTGEVFGPSAGDSQARMLERFEILPAAKHKLDWNHAERFLKQLVFSDAPITFEIVGNREQISMFMGCDQRQSTALSIAFETEHPESFLKSTSDPWVDNDIAMTELYPPPPYHHLFTSPSELVQSPLNNFLKALSYLPITSKGFMQILFQPARFPWQDNVSLLVDMEFLSRSVQPSSVYSSFRQQTPSAEMHQLSRDLELKAHPDKPFFSVILRIGVMGDTPELHPEQLSGFTHLIRHGGQNLHSISSSEIEAKFSQDQMQDMVHSALTYRHGFLMNSRELVTLCHIPSSAILKSQFNTTGVQGILPILRFSKLSTDGLFLGSAHQMGHSIPVYLNEVERSKNMHIIGKPGTGKTTFLENLILKDIEKGNGLAFIDPHGDAVKRILRLIPESQSSRVIYLDFGDPNWIPIWNPLTVSSEDEILRAVDDLINAIRSTVNITYWGDRLEHLMRHGFYALIKHGNTRILDMLHLFHQGHFSKSNNEHIQLVNGFIDVLDNPAAEMFWTRDYQSYKRDEFSSTHHKLSKLLMASETISYMLTQKENHLNLHDVLEDELVLLVDLSSVGDDARQVLGKFLLSGLFSTALYRSKIPRDQRKLFTIYCDEAHKLTTHALGDMLVESRKYGISLVLAHQYLLQFTKDQIDALSSAGTSVLFNIDIQDATHLSKDLAGKAGFEDIIELKTGEAIVKLGTDVLILKPPPPAEIPDNNFRSDIVDYSRQRFYKPINQVKAEIRAMEESTSPGQSTYTSDDELIREIIENGDYTLDYF